MNKIGFPGCCTAEILNGFDKIATMQWNLRTNIPTKEEVFEQCLKSRQAGQGILIAILTNTQKEGLKVLKECGFTRTRAISKTHHPETKLILLWKALDKL